MKKYAVTLLNAAAVFAALLLLWQGLDLALHVPPYMLPPPLAVGRAVIARFPSLMTSLAITSEEAAGGLAASIVVGVLIAFIFAQSRWIRRMLYPYTILLQTVPIVAVAPLILMWVGPGTAVGHVGGLHHLPGADHCQYHARVDQRGAESHPSLPHAQRVAVTDPDPASSSPRRAFTLCRHPHCGRHFGDRRHNRGAFCRVQQSR